jgi:hypothetical protein
LFFLFGLFAYLFPNTSQFLFDCPDIGINQFIEQTALVLIECLTVPGKTIAR